jgi:hypothetical protein
VRSFSSAFITTQSSSPFIIRESFAGSVLRQAATAGSVSQVESRWLGLGGSSSRITRRISSYAAVAIRFRSSGVLPVSNS